MTTDTPRPNAAARDFMLRAFSRPLMDQGYTAVAAAQILKKRYPWLDADAPAVVTIAKGQAAPPWTAWEKICQIAKRMVQTGEAPTLAQGVDMAVQQLPHLYRESQTERTALPPAAAPVAKQYGAAWDAIVTLAEARVAKSLTPTTRPQAIAAVLQERPDLYAQYEAERR